MKNYFLLSSVCLITLTTFSQTKVNFTNKIKIENSQVQSLNKGAKTVQQISMASLKNGHNYLTLKNGNILYFEVKTNKLKSVTLTKPDGIQVEKFTPGTRISKFECVPGLCGCKGDADCNDMFSSGLCGDAICIDEWCFCLRN
jgi:hypothetical protein